MVMCVCEHVYVCICIYMECMGHAIFSDQLTVMDAGRTDVFLSGRHPSEPCCVWGSWVGAVCHKITKSTRKENIWRNP